MATDVTFEYLDRRGLSEVPRPVERRAVMLAVSTPDIGAGREQQADDLHVTTRCREMQRRQLRVPMRPARVWIGAVSKQPCDSLQIVSLGHQVQRASALHQRRIIAEHPLGPVVIGQRQQRDDIHSARRAAADRRARH